MGKVLLGACGDISFKTRLEKHVKEKGIGFAFEEVRQSMKKADILFGNSESLFLPDSHEPREGLICSDSVAPCLKDGGFHILNLANNHLLDCGSFGLLHTYNTISDLGIEILGAGRNEEEATGLKVITRKGMKFGFLGYQEPNDCTYEGGGGRMAYFRLEEALEDIKRCKPLVDLLVVSFHGDMEFNPSPSLVKVNFCRTMAEAGADIILCHHPHVPQGVEYWNGSLIAYSLGNFAFDTTGYMMNGYPHTARSHIFFVEVTDGKITGWKREYFRISAEEGRPLRISAEEAREEDQYYRSLDDILKDPEKMRSLWHEASLKYFRKFWNLLQSEGPDKFISYYGFEVFMMTENRHWLNGMKEIITEEYEKKKSLDLEFRRPTRIDNV